MGDKSKILVTLQNNNRDNQPHKEKIYLTDNGPKAQKDISEKESENKVRNLINFLSGMKIGTKVFQHFLNKSSLALDLNGRIILKKKIHK